MKTCKECGDGTQPDHDLCDACEKAKAQPVWSAPEQFGPAFSRRYSRGQRR
jgi:uncharacterized OB-fold protein